MSEYWFYRPLLAAAGDCLTLSPDESHHATAVRRLSVGASVTVFDGNGNVAQGLIERIAGRKGDVTVRLTTQATQAMPFPLHLACAPAKGDRQAGLLDMATQLGMTAYTPLSCARGVVKTSDTSTARWQRICLEACKQSRRAYLPQLHAVATPAAFAQAAVARGETVLLAHPDGGSFTAIDARPQYTIMIGPEGGFTEEEIAQAGAAGAQTVRLGSGILRIETAAIAMLAALKLQRAE